MSTIVTRAGKGSPLTHTEVDNNFTNLNTDKYQSGNNASFGTLSATGATTFSGTTVISGSLTANTLSSSSATITGGTINSTAIGGTTAAAGKFTTLEATGVTTVQAGTVSLPAITTSGDTNTGIFFPAADTIAFTEGGVEAMRIDSSGNVGIGTSSPSARLQVNQTTSAGGGITVVGSSANTGLTSDFGSLSLQNTNTTNGNYNILGFVNDQGGFSSSIIGVYTSHTSGAQSGELAFFTRNVGSYAERMRLTSAGDLLVGTTNSSLTAGQGFKAIYNSGTDPYVGAVMASSSNSQTNYHLYSTGAGAYRFYVGMGGTISATSATITTISDQRLKENIVDIDVGLDAVMALKPRKFDWKAGKGKDKKGDRGWIAQEFETVFPEMIDTWKDPAPEGEEPYKAVNADLIPVLVKAIQEQQQIINDLKARIETLESN
jgi:hypothetical protein